VKPPPLATAHKALSAAITTAMEEPLTDELTEVDFVRYTAGGWGFRLVFAREVRETGPRGGDAMARRVEKITDRWEYSPVVREERARQLEENC
jgi:hypothetical protein